MTLSVPAFLLDFNSIQSLRNVELPLRRLQQTSKHEDEHT